MKKQYWLGGSMALVLGSAIALYSSDEAPDDSRHSGKPVTAVQTELPAAATVNTSIQPDKRTPEKVITHAGTGTTTSPPIPRPVKAPASSSADPVQLWDLSGDDDAAIAVDDIPATRIQVDPAHLEEFSVGQTLILQTPDGDTIETDLTTTHNDPNGVHVWQGDIAGARKEAAVIITRGEIQTHMIIANDSGTYSVVIDNRTGAGTLVDEGYIKELQAPYDDGIVVGPPDEIPLPVIN